VGQDSILRGASSSADDLFDAELAALLASRHVYNAAQMQPNA